MTQEYVLPIDDQRATLETMGGKGASLARLLRAGVSQKLLFRRGVGPLIVSEHPLRHVRC